MTTGGFTKTALQKAALLYVDRRLLIDEWHSQDGKETKSVVVNHIGGALPVELHYYEGSGSAQVHLLVSPTQD